MKIKDNYADKPILDMFGEYMRQNEGDIAAETALGKIGPVTLSEFCKWLDSEDYDDVSWLKPGRYVKHIAKGSMHRLGSSELCPRYRMSVSNWASAVHKSEIVKSFIPCYVRPYTADEISLLCEKTIVDLKKKATIYVERVVIHSATKYYVVASDGLARDALFLAEHCEFAVTTTVPCGLVTNEPARPCGFVTVHPMATSL